ncbi:alpha/beta hydrolase fold domain-containing protein [Kribbella sp. NPDC049227]|uniref:alpha/beta hydrolase fold domain-containing protein n=1 Tax=Kribbella sp. NPDC049227 TaxID=3364113 RepID=UPI0037211FCC
MEEFAATRASAAEPGPFDGPPPVEVRGDRLVYRDAVVARPEGFRPLLLDLVVPADGGPVPVVVWIHGGAWLRGSSKPYPTPVPVELIRDCLLDAGSAVANIQYRLSGEATFPAQLHDVKAAVRWLRHHAGELRLDPRRVGAWGDSAGGHLAALLAVTGNVPELEGDAGVTGVSSSIQACVDWYGPTDLASMQAQAHPLATEDHDAPDSPASRLVGAPIQTVPKLAAAASPVTHVSAGAPPILILHGIEDRSVPIGQSRLLADAYDRVGAPARFLPIAHADHVFEGSDHRPLVAASVDFLTTTLREHPSPTRSARTAPNG